MGPKKYEGERYLYLDGLRGLAIIGVVMVHCGSFVAEGDFLRKITEIGQYGVQLFFFISAFTIAMTYMIHINHYGRSIRSQLAWGIKRFMRIAPLYYVAMILYKMESIIPDPFHSLAFSNHGGKIDNLLNALFLHTWVESANNTVVPGGWSIGVEMFFYLLVPVIFLIHRSYIIPILAIFSILLVMFSFFISTCFYGTLFINNNSFLYLWFPTQFIVFSGGIVAFIYQRDAKAPFNKYSCIGFVVSLLFFIVAVYMGTWKNIAPAAAPAVLSVSFLFLFVFVNRYVRFLDNIYLCKLGSISYGVYIFHFISIDAIRYIFGTQLSSYAFMLIIISVLISAAIIAIVFRIFVELPFIRYGHDLSKRLCREAPSS